MHLSLAKLCLDCEELYVDAKCPKCASGYFIYLSAVTGTVMSRQIHSSLAGSRYRVEVQLDRQQNP
jgi:hypothetical protein